MRHELRWSVATAAFDGAMIVEALRMWRNVRDARGPIQPALSAVLKKYGCVMLAPVLDSLARLYEAMIDRRISVGHGNATSYDENVLLGMIAGRREPGTGELERSGSTEVFKCALASTRIMLGLAERDRWASGGDAKSGGIGPA